MKFQREARKSALQCLLLLAGITSMATQSGFAQNPLNFENNFFVTGDYIVAGAYNINQKFTTINGVGYTVGTINVPDKNPNGVANPGITGATSVPPGAQVVAALLYWQTVEKVGATGAGQNGFFRPLIGNGGPAAPGYAISGSNISGTTPVSWSSGGCNSGSTGKILRTYRADVGAGLPVDANGNLMANGSFEVRLPSTSSNSTPLTLGATLVIIYRIPTGAEGPNIPLNAIVIYDGDYAQSNTQLSMTQPLQGFYDADTNTVTRMTHIVGSGQSNKYQTVYMGQDVNHLTKLPFLYGNKLPAFPGWYGTWDNVTWTFTSGNSPLPNDSATATTRVVPSPMNQGCVSWGAVIVSTTVKDPQHDGILSSWKSDGGYCDAAINNGVCSHSLTDPGWVDLPTPHTGQQDKDVYLQYDYMCSNVTGPGSCHLPTVDPLSAAAAASGGNTTYTGTFSPTIPANTVVSVKGFTNTANNGQFTVQSGGDGTHLVVNNPNGIAETNPGTAAYGDYSFDPRLAVDTEDGKNPHDDAIKKVVAAYAAHNIHLHAIAGNAIEENQPNISCSDNSLPPSCVFPNEPGTVGFTEGLAYIKNTNIETTTGVIGGCTPGPGDPTCIPVFQHGKKDSYHYALFSHGVGVPSLFLSDGSLKSVQQTGKTVTFTTNLPHNITQITKQLKYATATDSLCPNGRVTVVLATTNQNLNGTYCVLSNPPPTATTFSISVGGSATNFTYTAKTDPDLAVANGQVTSISGYSDVSGQNSVISLGYGGWSPAYDPASDGNKWQNKAGTFMHELGHTMGLTHGGSFYNNLPADYTPTYEANCKPNVQTVMSYQFQFDLLQVPNQVNAVGKPLMVVDYSQDPPSDHPDLVPTLTESSPAGPGILSNNNLSYAKTAWFQLQSYSGGSAFPSHCDFTPLLGTDRAMSYVSDFTNNFFWSNGDPLGITGSDINFNGNATDVMHAHNEWEGTPAQSVVPVGPSPGLDLEQVSALGTTTAIGLGGDTGGLHPGGGGGLHPGGGGGLHPGGGGGLHPGGGGGLHPGGGGGEMTHEQANSYARPPQGLTITQEEASPRYIDLSWFGPTFGTVDHYNIKRSDAGGPFTTIASPPGSQTMYKDTVTCNPGGYRYEVTAVVNNDAGQPQESVPSNIVPASGEPLLTGCYTIGSFTVPASAVQGTQGVQISWTLRDDYYISPGTPWANAISTNGVTRAAANTLVGIGPQPGSCTPGRTTLVADGAVTNAGTLDTGNNITLDTFVNNGTNTFTFTWNRTDAFCAGRYTFELDLDHVSGNPAQSQAGPNALQLSIDVNDTDSTPHIDTLSVPDATVDIGYNDQLTQHGGVGNVTWGVASGSLPLNITLSSGGMLSGTPIVPAPGQLNFTSQNYNFTLKVTDSATPIANTGTQAFTMRLIAPVSFKSAPYNTGLSPQAVITADFDGDGKTDLAVANSGNNTVTVLMGHGDGTFTAQSPALATGSVPMSLAAGDFNGDGFTDLVVTNFANGSPSTVSVFLGTGGGNFSAPVTYAVGAGPISVVTGDFNGDHLLDLAVANQYDHTVSILLGNGDGTFQPQTAYQAGTTDVGGIAVGYFNVDGALDLVVTNPSSDTVSVLLNNNNGTGTFAAAVPYSTGNLHDHPVAVNALDLNGDGKLDLAVANLNGKTVAILLGNGDGTFQAATTYPTSTGTVIGPTAIATGDFNGDGKADMAITEQGNNTVSILLGNGNGTFQYPLEFSTGNNATGVAAGDFNGDGRLDLAVANLTDNTVSVMMHLPQPPTNVATTNVMSSQVSLSWTASTSSGLANYNVYRADTSGGPYALKGSPVGLSFTDTDAVTSGHTYYYVVTAVGAFSLESLNSNEVSVTTP